jgi:SAM-dependent methyltransferase
MAKWHLRRIRDPHAHAMRMLMFWDPVTPEEARGVLGDELPLDRLLDAGLLVREAGGIVSAFVFQLLADLYVMSDDMRAGGEAVMGAAPSTRSLAAVARPRIHTGSALDLGCGAGPVALLLARSASRVVASDVSPRALDFCRINLALHAVENVELRRGDLFETVRGERFDRIAAHPPFVARPDGARACTFVHGGTRGDELPLRVLSGASQHLTPGGRALVLGDWPVVEGDPLDARVRASVGQGSTDVLVLQSPPKNLDEYCTLLAAVEHRELGDPFARAVLAHRDHLERLGLRGLALALVVLAPGTGWTAHVPVRHVNDAPIGADAVERILASHSLASGPAPALAASRLRFPAGSRRTEQPMPDGTAPSLVVQPPPGSPEWPAVLDARVAALVARIAGAPSVADAGGTDAVDAAREALRRGALAVDS